MMMQRRAASTLALLFRRFAGSKRRQRRKQQSTPSHADAAYADCSLSAAAAAQRHRPAARRVRRLPFNSADCNGRNDAAGE